jgi:hypothetical protein
MVGSIENPKNSARPPARPNPVMPAKAGIHDFFKTSAVRAGPKRIYPQITQIYAETIPPKICANLRIESFFRILNK